MSGIDTILFGTAILIAQILLGAALFAIFFWMRTIERDTRLPEEAGRKLELEVIGAGRVGRSGWSRNPFCRLSLYDTFLVVSIRSTRKLIRYNQVASVQEILHGKKDAILIAENASSDEAISEIEFVTKEHESILKTLRTKTAIT